MRRRSSGDVKARSRPCDLHVGAGMRSVDEAAAADVHPDVADAVEEDEIAWAKVAACDAAAEVEVGVAAVGQCDAEVGVDEADEARAVEACRRRGAAPDVGDADHPPRVVRRRARRCSAGADPSYRALSVQPGTRKPQVDVGARLAAEGRRAECRRIREHEHEQQESERSGHGGVAVGVDRQRKACRDSLGASTSTSGAGRPPAPFG